MEPVEAQLFLQCIMLELSIMYNPLNDHLISISLVSLKVLKGLLAGILVGPWMRAASSPANSWGAGSCFEGLWLFRVMGYD